MYQQNYRIKTHNERDEFVKIMNTKNVINNPRNITPDMLIKLEIFSLAKILRGISDLLNRLINNEEYTEYRGIFTFSLVTNNNQSPHQKVVSFLMT